MSLIPPHGYPTGIIVLGLRFKDVEFLSSFWFQVTLSQPSHSSGGLTYIFWSLIFIIICLWLVLHFHLWMPLFSEGCASSQFMLFCSSPYFSHKDPLLVHWEQSPHEIPEFSGILKLLSFHFKFFFSSALLLNSYALFRKDYTRAICDICLGPHRTHSLALNSILPWMFHIVESSFPNYIISWIKHIGQVILETEHILYLYFPEAH